MATTRLIVAGRHHESGETQILPASAARPGPNFISLFECFIAMGMIPPLSEFCHVLLASYGLLISQLHPNAVLGMAIF